MEITLIREPVVKVPGKESFTPGKVYVNGVFLCFSIEDEDRRLEDGVQEKVYGRSAIPRGRYEIQLYASPKHGLVPMLLGVTGFTFIEIHGANHAEDLLGCIGVGACRIATGIAQCADTLRGLVAACDAALKRKERIWIEVK